jgi:DNA-directed RNA polymerase specialized sigma24 family protein
MRGRMLNYLRSESYQRKCAPMARSCHAAEDCDADNPRQEDCLPIGTTEALERTDRFLFEVDVRLLRGVIQECLAVLTERQRGFFLHYVDRLQPSEVARAVGVSAARVTPC